jgi:uncharacterized protein (DUF2147 family)
MDTTRRPDIDWLRVIATYTLFVFHVGMVFNPSPFFHLRNGDVSIAFLVVCGFISLWHMPLFFLLAGWSAAASLERRGTPRFLAERVRRLAVPLVAGCILLAPAIKYVELRSGLDLSHTGLRIAPELQESFRAVIPGGLPTMEPFEESFLAFLPTFFTRLDRFTWSHLWFVAYLFAFTLAYLPLLRWLLRHRDGFAAAPSWAIYLPVVPLVTIQLTLRERWPGIQNLYDDWANVAYYTVFLLAGFLIACHPALGRLVEREWRRSFVAGIAAAGALLLGVLGVVASPTVLLAGSAVAAWCFVVALLGAARRHLTATGPALAYLSESAFPVYVLHQAAIVLPGWLVVGLGLGIATKFVLLLLLSFAIAMATYHWLVRPFAGPRTLLGMKPKGAPVAVPTRMSRSAAAVLVAATVVAVPARTSASTPIGLWYAEGGAARVAIAPCGEALCGRVVWLRSPLDEDGCELRDRHNPDVTLRERPVVGLEVIRGLTAAGDGTWTGGLVYDPGSGNTYTCRATLEGDDRLRIRGYLGIPLIGRSTTWIRVGDEGARCAARR